MIQASKSPALKVTPCKDVQTLVCFLDNEPGFCDAHLALFLSPS